MPDTQDVQKAPDDQGVRYRLSSSYPFATTVLNAKAGSTPTESITQLTNILHELQELRDIQRQLVQHTHVAPLKLEAILDFSLQAFAVLIATCFGVFAILAWRATTEGNGVNSEALDVASSANNLAATANSVARQAAETANALAFCQAITTDFAPCTTIENYLRSSVSSFASSLLSSLPTVSDSGSPSNNTSPSDTPSQSASFGGIVAAAVIGGLALFGSLGAMAYVATIKYAARKERSQRLDHVDQGAYQLIDEKTKA